MKYPNRHLELTPQLFPPTALRLTWTLHLLSFRDHALWRADAFCGTGEERVGLYMGPCPGPQDPKWLAEWCSAQTAIDVVTGLAYLAEPPEPFPEVS